MNNISNTIQITPSSKFIGTHKYPNLREDAYQVIINYLNDAVKNNDICGCEKLIECTIERLLSNEEIGKNPKNNNNN